MGDISKGLIHATDFTDLHIRIAAEGVDHQMAAQGRAAPKAVGWNHRISIRIHFFIFTLGGF